MNEAALDKIHSHGATISEDTLEAAVDWINRVTYSVLETHMKSEAWQFNWEDEYNDLTGPKLRELAEDQMYEDASYVGETIDKCMNLPIVIAEE